MTFSNTTENFSGYVAEMLNKMGVRALRKEDEILRGERLGSKKLLIMLAI